MGALSALAEHRGPASRPPPDTCQLNGWVLPRACSGKRGERGLRYRPRSLFLWGSFPHREHCVQPMSPAFPRGGRTQWLQAYSADALRGLVSPDPGKEAAVRSGDQEDGPAPVQPSLGL